MKIVLAPSNQDANIYAYGGTNEAVQCTRIANHTAAYLKKYHCEVFNWDGYKYGFSERISKANNMPADIFVSIHTNAGGGRGVTAYVDRTGKMDALGKKINENISALGVYNRGLAKRLHTDGLDWYTELRTTRMPAIMMECAFHDNYVEAKFIVDNVKPIGEAIAKGIVSVYSLKARDVKPVDPKPTDPTPVPKPVDPKPSTLYRVQVGAFKNSANAMAMEKKLKDADFPTYVIFIDGLIKVQVGAYAKKENALAMEKKLKDKGFETYITTKSGVKYTPPKNEVKPQLRVGHTVRIKKDAKDYYGNGLLQFVYERDHVISEIAHDRAVVTYRGVVVAAVHLENLIRV